MTSPLVPADLLRFVVAVDPQVVPDGSAVVYRRTAFDAGRDAVGGTLWRLSTDGSDRMLTAGRNDRMPRIAPDGRSVVFLRDADDETFVFVLPLDGGEPRRLGDAVTGCTSLAWSPDGRSLALTARAPFDAATAHIAVHAATGVRHIRALPYKTDADGLLDGRRTQLFVRDVATGEQRQLTFGGADAGAAAWSPDGTHIAVTRKLPGANIFLADIAVVAVATGAVRRLTHGEGPMSAPSFAPDGRRIAWLGHERGDEPSVAQELLTANADGGERRSLSAKLDRPALSTVLGDLRSGGPLAPVWRNEREIYCLVSDGGDVSLRAFDAEDGSVRVVAGGERDIYAFDAANGRLAIAFATPVVPSALAFVDPDGTERTRTDLNPWLRDREVAEPRAIGARAADGTPLDAWLLLPAHASGGAFPLALEIHGGPHATFGNTFFFEFQILAACGIAVAYGNPRGSQGYGNGFSAAADWGGVDASDVLAILDAALAGAPLDPARVAAVGGSYGGFMTTWLLGHSRRFATGISMRACNDYVSFTMSTDIGFFLQRELGADLTNAGLRRMFEASPTRALDAIDVPFLIMHSERDYRCPIDQGEGAFNLLQMLGKRDVEFVRFAGDGHELSRAGKPGQRVVRLRAIANWLRRHLCGAAEETGAGSLFRPLPNESTD